MTIIKNYMLHKRKKPSGMKQNKIFTKLSKFKNAQKEKLK